MGESSANITIRAMVYNAFADTFEKAFTVEALVAYIVKVPKKYQHEPLESLVDMWAGGVYDKACKDMARKATKPLVKYVRANASLEVQEVKRFVL